MKLISLNIEENKHHTAVLNFIYKEKPDVVCFQELVEEDFEIFKKELKMNGVYQVFKYVDIKFYPDLKGKKMGVGIFAKNIVDSGYTFYVGKEENSRVSYEEFISNDKYRPNYVLVWAEIKDDKGEIYKFVTTHFFLTKEGEASVEQLAALDSMFRKLEPLGDFVLCGDMNAPRGKETFNRLTKKFKDNIPLEYKTSLDQNLHRVTGLELMVDGLFTTSIYHTSNVKLVDGISDHMAIVADIEKLYN